MEITNHAGVVIYTRGAQEQITPKYSHVSLVKCGTTNAVAAQLGLVRANSNSVSDRSKHDMII